MSRGASDADLQIDVVAPHPDQVPLDDRWDAPTVELVPQRLLDFAADRRFETQWLIASEAGVAVGVLSLHRCRMAHFPDPLFDPRHIAPTLFADNGPAGTYLLIGGATHLAAGASVDRHLSGPRRHAVRMALGRAAFAEARRRDLVAAALYVRDTTDFPGTDHVGLDVFGHLQLVSGVAYPGSLKSSLRSIVRRDWRRRAEAGLRCSTVDAAGLVTAAAPLVASIKQRHEVPEHPRLTALRLTAWSASPVGHRFAIAVHDPAGTLVGVGFVCGYVDRVEVYEIGLLDDHPDRHLAYVEALVYAPIRWAELNGVPTVHLGLGTVEPKRLRGAVFDQVWALADNSRRTLDD